MSDIIGFPMVTIVLDEPRDAGSPTAYSPAVAVWPSDDEIAGASKRFSSAATPECQSLCTSILGALGDVQGKSPVLLLAATHTSPYLDEAARLVASAFADYQSNPVALADVSPEAVIMRSLAIEPRDTAEAIAQGKMDVRQAVVQTDCPGLCLLSSGGSIVSNSDAPRLLTRLRSVFDLVIVYGGSADSAGLKALRRHADGCLLLIGQSLSKRRAISARDCLQGEGGGSLLGFILASAD